MSDEHATDGDDLSLPELLERHRDAWLEELHVATPAIVVSFNATTQRVDVEPATHRRLARRDGSGVRELLPTLRSVPVVFPGAGDWFVRFPIEAGDEGFVIFLDRDPARWLQTGDRSDPLDVRTHHLAHAIFLPGLRSRPNQLPAPAGTGIEIGKVGGASILIQDDGSIRLGGAAALVPVADATKVDAIADAIAGAANGDAIPAAVAAAITANGGTTALTGVTGQ